MKLKSVGWRKEPARHALAAKGVETGQRNSGSQTALLPSKQALQSHTLAVGSDLKRTAVEDLLGRLLDEADQDEEKATDLINDQQWFDQQVKAVAHDHSQGRMADELERELRMAFADAPKSATDTSPAKPDAKPKGPTP